MQGTPSRQVEHVPGARIAATSSVSVPEEVCGSGGVRAAGPPDEPHRRRLALRACWREANPQRPSLTRVHSRRLASANSMDAANARARLGSCSSRAMPQRHLPHRSPRTVPAAVS